LNYVMAINLISEGGKTVYGLKEFVLDYADDYKKLPLDCAVGSRALIIENGKVYILNSLGKWVEI